MILYIKIVIDRILKQAVDKDNKIENLANFNRSAGVRESLNENLIPEQLFDDPNTQEKEAEGISAVKALQIASSQGQTIYTVTKANYSEILPKLNHSTDVMTDVRNAINAGKEVTISQTQVHAFGWSGTGYIVIDPKNGTGAYLIGGGDDGGATFTKNEAAFLSGWFLGVSFTALSVAAGLLVGWAILPLLFAIAFFVVMVNVIRIILADTYLWYEEGVDCFEFGIKWNLLITSPLGWIAAALTTKSLGDDFEKTKSCFK